MHEQMHEWAEKQWQPHECAGHMGTVLGKKKEPCNGKEA